MYQSGDTYTYMSKCILLASLTLIVQNVIKPTHALTKRKQQTVFVSAIAFVDINLRDPNGPEQLLSEWVTATLSSGAEAQAASV